MRLIVFAATTVIAAVANANPPPMGADQSAYNEPARPWTSVDQAERDRICRDRIQQVRDTSGQPDMPSETASPDKPLRIAAVDKRIDGCSVMVMHHDTSDIRPLPKIEQQPEIIPAR